LLIHLFGLFLPQPLSMWTLRESAPLHVRLRHAEPPHETVRLEAPPATAAAPAQVATPSPPPKRLERHAAPSATEPVLAGTSGESSVQQSETGTAPAKPDTGTVATQAPTETRSVAEADTPDPQALAGFGRAFSSLLAARQQYPRLAAMRGWEGEVRLRVHIAMKGNIVSILLVQSSGFELLDQAAIKLVEACSQLPPLPLALQGHDFDILVPVQYRLARAG
jgi:protein TonB